ncbi:MAG: N-formylglutamate amidohydrolase [Pseudomonadota bacterium]
MITTQAYILTLPQQRLSPAVFNSPHSGRDYAARFLQKSDLAPHVLRSSEDAYVDELFAAAPEAGAPLMTARAPRAFVDLNRAASELDPSLVQGVPKIGVNPRVAAGLGVIPRVVAEGKVIRRGRISLTEARGRLRRYYEPYHERLQELLSAQRARFGLALLFDCHSMPHEAVLATPHVNGRRPDIVLGDRFGASCDRWVIEEVADAFARAGFTVARNAPFAGGYITQNYGIPERGLHALQIEIDRALYLDERRISKTAGFGETQRALDGVIADLTTLGGASLPLAAE